MDLTDFPTHQPSNPPRQPLNNQGRVWAPARVLKLATENPAHEPEQTAHHSTYPLPHHANPPATFQQGQELEGEGGGLGIRAYLHIPCVNKLHSAHFESTSTVTRLYTELNDARAEIARLKEEFDSFASRPEGLTNYATFRRQVSGSLAPSDSLSQRISQQSSGDIGTGSVLLPRAPRPQPPTRPDHFPFEILWQKEDCKEDIHGAQPVKSNGGRPRMKNAIRNKDGTIVTKSYFKSIQKTVKKQVGTLIQEEEERLQSSLPVDKMTKTYFETIRTKQWMRAIEFIEAEHPILTYAAGHWKAEQLLTNRLTVWRNGKKKAGPQAKKVKRSVQSNGKDSDSSEDDDESEEEGGGGGNEKAAVGSKRKRDKPVSNPSEMSNSRPSKTPVEPSAALIEHDIPIETQARGQHDVEMEVDRPPSMRPMSEIMVEKRIGKQAQASVAFAAISAAALQLGGTRENSQPNTTNRPFRTSPLDLISVDATYDGLKDAFSTTFNKNLPPHATELLEALQKIPVTAASNGNPSPTALQFIERIEAADPNAPDIDEDDTNIGWGHIQFTSGSLTCRSVLRTWADIGNVKIAYRLLAASLKTCLVARHLCFTNKISVSASSSYLSDSYLRQVVEILWELREQELNMAISAPPLSGLASASGAASISHSDTSDARPLSKPASSEPPTAVENSKRLERLHTEELKTWMTDHSIPLPPHNKRKKNDIIMAIIAAGSEKIPTDEDISRTIGQRTSQKRTAAKST